MATIRERRPGVWESGSSPVAGLTASPRRPLAHRPRRQAGRPTSRRLAGRGSAPSAGRDLSELLDEWVVQNLATWAPASARDQESRVRSIKRDTIRVDAAGPAVRWATWSAGTQGSASGGRATLASRTLTAVRAVSAEAQRWGWVFSQNVAVAVPGLGAAKRAPSEAMLAGRGARRHLLLLLRTHPAAALRPSAWLCETGARRAEALALAVGRCSDLRPLTIDWAAEIVRVPGSGLLKDGYAATKTVKLPWRWRSTMTRWR